MNLRQATRKQAKIKLALQGPSGSGKTYSALLIASGMTDYSKVAVIDTENHSADLYAHLGNYNVLPLSAPFTPERYIKALEACVAADMEVVIIDSVSHEWEGSGGILDLHGRMAGNSFTNWSKVTPRHNAFVQKMIEAPCHIIATIRSKQDYTLTDKNGKLVPEKVGLKGIQRDGLDYEFTIVFDLDIRHNAVATKDRTGLFMDRPEGIITPGYGNRILRWCGDGVSVYTIIERIQEATTTDQLRDLLRQYPEYRTQLEPEAIKRKEELSTTIINTNKLSNNGTEQD